jgi:hypothetical protein
MSHHAIHLPYRSVTDPFLTVVDAARHSALTDDDRATVRQIVLSLATDGVATVGEALAVLEAASPAQRRTMLDAARHAGGLPSTAAVDRQRAAAHRVEPIEDEPERDEAGATFPVCHEDGCRAYPVDPATGAPQKHRARRWRCSEHVAGHEEDMLPWTSSIVMGPAGLRDLDAEEAERVAGHREAERHAITHTQRAAARAAELPTAEIEAAAEADAWVGANLRWTA